MPTPVVMPQMGESIAEGTIVRWIKKVGDPVDRDEPLFEISTDKVDAEIPSPAAGVLTEITVKEGETVAVNSVVATIGAAGETVSATPSDGPAKPLADTAKPLADTVDPLADTAEPLADRAEPLADRAKPLADRAEPQTDRAQPRKGAEKASAATQPQADGSPTAAPPPAPTNGSESAEPSKEDVRRQKSSPLVRRIAKEHNVDISQIPGSGIGGRVTKHDILGYIENGDSGLGTADSGAGAREAEVGSRDSGLAARPGSPAPDPGSRVELRPLSVMRKKIAEHMILSRRTSAHVHSVFHVNFSTIEKIRQQKKAEYERVGARLTYMAFIATAVVDALRRHPIVNASIDGDNVVYRKDIHLGIAVALDSGLIVPVVKHADERNLLGLSRAIADVAERARAKQLKPDEVHGGTFTITNPGQFGAQFGMPIINQPQVAILGVGTIEKRPVVVDDAIAIRTMAYLTLGYDHRLVDGAVADQFMSDVKTQLESFDVKQV
jgi:pyruvate dehydrogenase E2 component (dihydrolipoamide acetyltransferase)